MAQLGGLLYTKPPAIFTGIWPKILLVRNDLLIMENQNARFFSSSMKWKMSIENFIASYPVPVSKNLSLRT